MDFNANTNQKTHTYIRYAYLITLQTQPKVKGHQTYNLKLFQMLAYVKYHIHPGTSLLHAHTTHS